MTTLENRPTATPDWATQPTPDSPEAWLARAREVRDILASDAAARDKAAETPFAEVALLKDSGLVTLLGPTAEGGAGQEWPLAYRVIREISAGDGSHRPAARLPLPLVLGGPARGHEGADRGRRGRRHPQQLVLRRRRQPA